MKLKSLVMTAAVMLIAVQGYSQGTLIFANGTTPDTRIRDGRTGAPAAANTYTVGLYFGAGTISDVDQLNLGPTTGISPLSFLAGVFSAGTVTLDGVENTASVEVRAWDSAFATYEEAWDSGRGDVYVGRSGLLTVPLGDGSSILPGDIVADGGFAGFTTQPVPEPSTIAFGILGGIGAMVLLRRRK
jgi:hypothetical protein